MIMDRLRHVAGLQMQPLPCGLVADVFPLLSIHMKPGPWYPPRARVIQDTVLYSCI